MVAVVDLSRSMFAGAPTRVELARLTLLDRCDALQRRGGTRVGLVAFAGRAELLCPLTHDLQHFRETVDGIDPQTPDAALGSGTRIGAALAFAGGVFDGRSPAARDVLLLSDGDDPARDGEFRLGIEALRAEGVAVHAIGFGDRDTPQRIPDGRAWLSHEGQEVRTRLEEAPLREIARRTGGQLWLAGTRPFPLGEQYAAVTAARADEDSPDAVPVLRQRQEWLLVPAFVLLLLALLLPGTRPASALVGEVRS
ncbi:MAG: VWA domain-containing protein [Gemmataceae bacterium]